MGAHRRSLQSTKQTCHTKSFYTCTGMSEPLPGPIQALPMHLRCQIRPPRAWHTHPALRQGAIWRMGQAVHSHTVERFAAYLAYRMWPVACHGQPEHPVLLVLALYAQPWRIMALRQGA